jgi:hypothetical protein
MSVKNYRFVSPGVFVNEIDNSQLPASPAGQGPVIIGRAAKGPALRPVTVNSFEEFTNIFGIPASGDPGSDVWREGNNTSAPTYGAYAAQAYLRNSAPLTYIRLLGDQTTANGGPSTTAGNAGWDVQKAYGLVVFGSASTDYNNNVTGALAAIFYTNHADTKIELSGALGVFDGDGSLIAATGSDGQVSGSSLVVAENNSVDKQFKALVKAADGSTTDEVIFNFTEADSRYIRKVFNTNPQRANSTISNNPVYYWLGETFDRHLAANVTSTTTFAAVVEIKDATNSLQGEDHLAPLQGAQTPAIISSRPSAGTEPVELMTFHALGEPGDWSNRNLKISIQDIARSTNESSEYGTFSVVIRHLSDSDNVVRVVEQFNNCDLNPDSLNYVARKIGDRYEEWSEDERRYVQRGDYDNNSSYIRVAVASDVAAKQTDAAALPFGWRGIVKYNDEDSRGSDATSGFGGSTDNWLTASNTTLPVDFPLNVTTGSTFVFGGESVANTVYSASVLYPVPELRVSASAGNLSNGTDAYFGYQTTKTPGGTVYDTSNIDLLRPRGGMVANMFAVANAQAERSMQFTLDDVAQGPSSESGVWVSGSHNAVTANGAPFGSYTYASGAVSGVLDAGYDRFTVPMYGGFDGTDVLEMDPFSNRVFPVSPNDRNSYTFNTIRRAIDSIADPEVVQMNVASMPGLTNEGLTTNLVRTCEDRADALAVIDLPNGYTPREDGLAAARNNSASTIRQAVNGLRSRGLNSSYGCTFYPWVRARDAINGTLVWLPPSVAAIGTFSSSQRKTQVWFAPAGFNRGGLSEGAAGIPVIDVAHQLRRKDRDDLYAANINPIAKFPAEGIVIFGQKTLQVTPSALDRINVRRLMIFVKKRISQMASQILFDPNVKTTWARFTSKVNPFLANVKTNFGLSDYKVILDETTTTAELIDRNILYAQIFLKPTRAIEFIAIDFNITRTGASFDD